MTSAVNGPTGTSSGRTGDGATFDLVLGPWRWPSIERRTFRIFRDGPTEHRYTLWIGPLHVSLWPKAGER